MRKTVLLLSLATASLFGAEVRIDQPLAPVQFGAARARQESARVASDGTNFFAVWRTQTAWNAVVIGAGRISPAGELLDRPSILIASGAANTLGGADVVFVGGNFLVVYQSGTSVLTRRFSRDGRPVDTQPLTISNTSMFAGLATNGKTVLLPTAPNRIRMLAADGTTLGPELPIPNAGGGKLSIASNGDRYLIAISSDGSGSGLPNGAIVLLTGMGNLLSAKQPLADDPLFLNGVAVASNGTSFLVGVTTPGLVGCMHVDADGNIGTLNRLDFSYGRSVVATWSGGEYTLVWSRGSTLSSDIVGVRVGAGGQRIDTRPVTVAFAGFSTVYASAWNGRDTIIITGENSLTTAAIFTSLPQIDAEPAARRRVAIASSAAEQASGSIASNGTLSLVTWRERSGLDQTIVRAAFIAADGQLGSPIELGDAHSGTTTATTSNGRDFFVSYYDTHYRLVGRRVTLEGLMDSTPIVITPISIPGDSLAAGWSGQAYVVVTAGAQFVTLSGVTPDGIVTVSRQVITSADTPAVSCAANGCSVTWHLAIPLCYFEGCPTYPAEDVFARTDAYGNLVLQVSLANSYGGVTPALLLPAADGRSMFVYSNGKTMYAGRITAGGVVLDTPAVNGGVRVMTSETSFALQPVAVVNGGLYFVEPDNDTSGRLYWTRIEPEPAPHVTSLVNLHERVTLPVTLTASARNTYLVYSRGEDDPSLMAPRLFLRTLASPEPQTSPGRRHAVH